MAKKSNRNRSRKSNAPPVESYGQGWSNQGAAKPASGGGPRNRQFLIAGILLIAVMAVFWPCVNNDFVNCDDDLYVSGNPHVQQGFTTQSIHWAFTTFEATNWHPLTWLSHILAWDLFGPKPAGHHFINVLLHSLNAALLFVVLEMMTGLRWKSLAVAAIFALHPLRVESVAWVAERKDVLSTTLWFLAIGAHVCYARKLRAKQRVGMFYALALGLFAVALLIKPMVVTLPFTLLLLDYWPLKRTSGWRRVWLEKIPYLALSAASCAVTYVAQKSGDAVATTVPIYILLETALLSYARYILKMFWPSPLAMQYPYPHHWPAGGVLSAAAGVIFVSAMAVNYRKRWPWLPVGWFWYLGTLVPVIGLVQVGLQSMADRYTYIPEIGMALIWVWGLCELWRRLSLPPNTLAAIGAAWLCVCAFLTVRQIGFWRNSETLFSHAVEVTSGNYSAYEHLGDYYFKQGNPKKAMEAFLRCLEIDPKNEEALSASAYILFFDAGQREAGVEQLEKAVALKPNSASLHNNLGMFYKEQGRYADAEPQLRETLRLNPDYVEADVGLAYIFLKDGRRDEAIGHLKHALQVKPELKIAQKMLDQATSGPTK